MKIKKTIMFIAIAMFLFSTTAVSAETTGSTTAEITFEKGTITLAEMSTFGFGEQTISAELESYPAEESKIYLDVRDLRGTGKGWKVTAKASEFNPGDNPTLPGASINFINGDAVSSQFAGTMPNVNQNITLDCDGEASDNIAIADNGSGLGVWTIEWNGIEGENINTTLKVPGGIATTGKHTTTIVWTLEYTP